MTDTTIRLPTKRELVQEKYNAPEQACNLSDYADRISKDGKLEAAIVALRRAIAITNGEHPILLSHLGAFLWDIGQYTEAEQVLRRSIEIEPEYAPSRANMASVLGAVQKFDESEEMSLKAIELEPDFIDAKWNHAITMLDSGQWDKAWPFYESRSERGDKLAYPPLPFPKWKGQDLNRKTLWVQGEQGCGDRILFSRYLAWVKKLFPKCRIIYQMSATDLPNMDNLMWGYNKIVEFVPSGIPWIKADYGVYLMSLPMLHGTTPDNVPPDPGYILEQAERNAKSVNLPNPLLPSAKIGVIWSGSPRMKRNIERSVPFEVMMRLNELPNVVLYSLQYDNNDLYNFGAGYMMKDLTQELHPLGFVGTAAAMMKMDLIITACTATAHLAGVLGVPCWVLLNHNPYWLWLRNRSDCVWYPNVRLFRQPAMYDWSSIFEEVKSELASFADTLTQTPNKEKQVA